METRRSARLRAKGRRRWAGVDSEDDGNVISEDSEKERPTKRARVEGLDDEAEENDDEYVQSDSGEEDITSRRSRSRSRVRTAARKSPTGDKNWDQLFEEDDENHESETVKDYPIEVEVFGVDKYFVIDGYVYRKLPSERKCGLGGYYLRCRQDKALKCNARAIVIRTEDGRVLAKLSAAADRHSHELPPDGSFLVPVPHENRSRGKRGLNRRSETGRRRGRPPKVIADDDGNETDDGEKDHPSRYKTPVEIYGLQKYFVMDGYVYRRHRDRRIGLRGVYLRCYQDKDFNCAARAVGVWFRRRSDLEQGERGERLLFGRLSTRYSKHSHPKPPKGHFWVKPGQNQFVFVPPHLRKSAAGASEGSVEFADFTDIASEANLGQVETGAIGHDPHFKQQQSKSLADDHQYDMINDAERAGPSSSSGFRKRQYGQESVPGGIRSGKATAIPAQAVQSGAYYIIDGYAFKRTNGQQSLLICVESNRESKCSAMASLLPMESTSRQTRAAGLKAQFANAGARKHNHSRPTRGQYFVAPTPAPSFPAVKPATLTMKGLPPSSGMLLFTRTPFVRALIVQPRNNDDRKGTFKSEPRMVNLKSIMNCYRHCLDALIRLQDGHYVERMPQLNQLVGAPGSELIDYFTQRSDNQLPMIAADERTKFVLNHELKHYRAVVDFMLLAPDHCEGLLVAYRRWMTPAKSRAWWNNGDILEYVCRLLLRTSEYNEAYEVALATSHQSTRLRHLFRPLLPLPEPKYLRCERETVRRWEMRQSLETVNSRITSVRLREGDTDTAINRLLDEFEGAVASFRKFLSRYDAERNTHDEHDASSDSSDEDWQAKLESKSGRGRKKRTKRSWQTTDPPPVLTAAIASDSDREDAATILIQ